MIRRSVIPFLWLLFVWTLLWGEPSLANAVSGVIVAGGLLALFPLSHIARRGRLRPLRAIGFVFFFAWELIKATMAVAWEIITPGSTIEQGIIGIDVLGASDTLVTLVANFITLTPGTLTVEVVRHPTRLYIHVLHLRDVEAVRADVQRLEALAIRAFGSPEAIALLEGGIPSRDGVPGADRNLEEQP